MDNHFITCNPHIGNIKQNKRRKLPDINVNYGLLVILSSIYFIVILFFQIKQLIIASNYKSNALQRIEIIIITAIVPAFGNFIYEIVLEKIYGLLIFILNLIIITFYIGIQAIIEYNQSILIQFIFSAISIIVLSILVILASRSFNQFNIIGASRSVIIAYKDLHKFLSLNKLDFHLTLIISVIFVTIDRRSDKINWISFGVLVLLGAIHWISANISVNKQIKKGIHLYVILSTITIVVIPALSIRFICNSNDCNQQETMLSYSLIGTTITNLFIKIWTLVLWLKSYKNFLMKDDDSMRGYVI